MYAAALVVGLLVLAPAADAAPTAEQLEHAIGDVIAIPIADAAESRTDLRPSRRLVEMTAPRIEQLRDLIVAMPPGRDRDAGAAMVQSARAWVTESRAALDAEESCRTSDYCMGLRVCEAVDHRAMLMTSIAEERANPAGVVDLRYLHQLGQGVQDDDKLIASRKAWFAFARHKPWTRTACTPPTPADAGAENRKD